MNQVQGLLVRHKLERSRIQAWDEVKHLLELREASYSASHRNRYADDALALMRSTDDLYNFTGMHSPGEVLLEAKP